MKILKVLVAGCPCGSLAPWQWKVEPDSDPALKELTGAWGVLGCWLRTLLPAFRKDSGAVTRSKHTTPSASTTTNKGPHFLLGS